MRQSACQNLRCFFFPLCCCLLLLPPPDLGPAQCFGNSFASWSSHLAVTSLASLCHYLCTFPWFNTGARGTEAFTSVSDTEHGVICRTYWKRISPPTCLTHAYALMGSPMENWEVSHKQTGQVVSVFSCLFTSCTSIGLSDFKSLEFFFLYLVKAEYYYCPAFFLFFIVLCTAPQNSHDLHGWFVFNNPVASQLWPLLLSLCEKDRDPN